jgi:hypothetical protein
MRKRIGIEVLDPSLGGLSEVALQNERRYSAYEAAPGIWRVQTNTVQFAFTQHELNREDWIREIPEDDCA